MRYFAHYGGLQMNTTLAKSNKRNFFDRVFTDNCYCWLAALCAAAIAFIVAFCYDMFPFGKITILRMDMYHQYCPLFAELYDRVTGLQSFMYSWETGMGTSFIGNFYNYLCSPSAIFVLLFGHENVPEAIAAMIFSKSAFAAAAFTYYLKRHFNKSDFTTTAFGLLYCMCGWFIAYYWDVMWVDSMVFFPFTILGIEKIIDSRKPLTYIFSLFLILLTNYYMGYMVCIFSILYFLAYYFSKNGLTDHDNYNGYWTKLNGKTKMNLRQRLSNSIFFRCGITFAAGSVIAGLLCAFALLPVFFILKNCYATSDSFPKKWELYFSIFDFIANHISSVEPTIRSSGDVVLPNIWCGIGTTMLVPLYLFTKSIPIKEKISNTLLLGIMFVSFNVNVFSFVWHGFHYPSDLPFRFSFMYCFILLTIAYRTITRINEFTGRQILGTGLAFIGFVILVQEIGSQNVNDTSVILSIVFIVCYTLIFYAGKNSHFQNSAVAVMLLCCVIAETVCSTVPNYDIDQPKNSYASDYKDFKALKNDIDKKDNEEFYRMELTYNRARMAPAWYNYNGISTFTSMAYESLSKLEKSLGLASNNVDSYTYHLQTPIYNMMHSLKYIFDNDSNVEVEGDYYTEIESKGAFTAYSVNHYLPIAYCVNNDTELWYYNDDNPLAVQEEWFELATGLPFAMEREITDDISYYNIDEITSGLASGDIYYDKTNPGENGEITFWIRSDEPKHYYLYVDSSQFDSIEIEHGEFDSNQSIDEPYVWDVGIVDENTPAEITIRIDEDDDYGNFSFYVYSINDYAIDSGYNLLKENAIDVSSFKSTNIKGKITVPEGKFIYTSIPYDTGWTVKLNNKKVDKDKLFALGDGMLCIRTEPGEYDIEFSFVQKGLIEGTVISLFALTVLVIFIIYIKKRKERIEYENLLFNSISNGDVEIETIEIEEVDENTPPSINVTISEDNV